MQTNLKKELQRFKVTAIQETIVKVKNAFENLSDNSKEVLAIQQKLHRNHLKVQKQ